MGHRKKSAPRRGSLAFSPRARASRPIARVRTWGQVEGGEPRLLGFAGFKAGCLHVITTDDRENTPNFGKPLFNAATVIETPPLLIIGFRAYRFVNGGEASWMEGYVKGLPKELDRKTSIKEGNANSALELLEREAHLVSRLVAIACIIPKEIGLSQKKPFLFEVDIGGSDIKARIAYLKQILGKRVPIEQVFKAGMYVDVMAITKGKGFEGPITRHGVKRKQHKSRKSVRAVAAIGPWHPASVMYTVPRAGQRGYHQRTEYNKRILLIGEPSSLPINPKGGFPHYGDVRAPFIVLRGSVPGPAKRLIKIRPAIRPPTEKVKEPQVISISTQVS